MIATLALMVLSFGGSPQEPQPPVRAAAENPPAPHFTCSQDEIDRLLDQVKIALHDELNLDVPGDVRARAATTQEIAKVVREETLASAASKQGESTPKPSNEMEAPHETAMTSEILLAKYAFLSHEILVNFETIAKEAQFPGREATASLDGLRVLLIHECIHAIDHARHDLGAMMKKANDRDAMEATRAVIEGHAEYVTHQMATRLGLLPAFDAQSLGTWKPQDDGTATSMIQRVVLATLASAYVDGAKFIAALDERGGDAAIDRAFQQPPARFDLIDHPDWYLDPSLVPKTAVKLDSGLDRFSASVNEKLHRIQRNSPNSAQLHAVMARLDDPSTVEQILKSVVEAKFYIALPGDSPSSLSCFLTAFRTHDEAISFFVASKEIQRINSKGLDSGPIHIKEMFREALSGPFSDAYFIRSVVAIQHAEVTTQCLLAVRGTVEIEILISNEPATKDQLVALASAVLDAATGVGVKTEPLPEK